MKVFVTGASGFVGGHLTRALLGLAPEVPNGDSPAVLEPLEVPFDVEEVRVLGRAFGSDLKDRLAYFAALTDVPDLIERAHLVRTLEDIPVVDSSRENPLFALVEGSLTSREALQAGLFDVDVVVHCAARASDFGSWKEFYGPNVDGTGTLVEACVSEMERRRGERPLLVVNISTVDVYGYPTNASECSETAPTVLGTDGCSTSPTLHDIRRTSSSSLPYPSTKAAAEVLNAAGRQKGGYQSVTLRPANVYGNHLSQFTTEVATLLEDRMMLFVNQGETDGGFVHIDDVVRAIILAMERGNTLDGETFNISNGGATWKDFSVMLAREIGAPRPWIELPFWFLYGIGLILELLWAILVFLRVVSSKGRPPVTRMAVLLLGRPQHFDISAARISLGWEPLISVEDGVKRAGAWWRSRRVQKKSL